MVAFFVIVYKRGRFTLNSPYFSLDLSKELSSLGSYSEEIEILSERSGESAGEHKITLKRPNELIEISHSALDRSLFADGALEAVKWISNQTPGLYTMNDIYSS